ncbi:MAG TPA: hypothetical protein VN451_08140, partial [Chitinophagaceae bacterium]|nr:hypothetical protein [Chitinophagaceae bacterium]
MIATIETTTGNKFFLVLLDAETGKVIKRFDNPGNKQYLQPHFTKDSKSILMVKSVPGYKSIVKIDVQSGEIKNLLNAVPENLSAPVDYKNFVLYNSPQTGIDNIYAVDTLTGAVYRVTNRKFGAFNPNISPDNTSISFQDFTPNGFRIVEMLANPEEWPLTNYKQDTGKKVDYYKPYASHEAGNILTRITDSVYPAYPYKKLRHAFNIFGWGIDPVTNLPQISLGVRSVDMLSTTTVQAGIRYDNDEKEFAKYFMLDYQGLYPQFFFTFLDGRRKTIFPESEGIASLNGISYDLVHYRRYTIGTQLPLNLSSGPYIRKTNITIQGGYTDFTILNRRTNENGYNKNKLGNFYSMEYDAYYEMRLRQSMRDVGPRFGSILQFSFRNTPARSFFQATQKAADAVFFLPGFFKHHSIRLRYNWQEDDNSTYHFENRFDFVRNKRSQLFHQWNLWSVDYKLQLCYPEAAFLNGLLYFQRIKADFFAEYGTGKLSFANTAEKNRYYTNLGVELTSDVNLLRFLVPFDAGIRVSYLTQNKSVLFGIIVKAPNIF